ncbi:alpha/beta fold hydrolase [Planococcus shixiaomingii]|uniref:alpha/beta fold hydrolase n=1 Tax=Planococcus shixiaomingii TaxID=3058393 RepID=UPI00260A1845|nr:alpha/beta hydrolase [Planococcus sp. N022]WKA55988.1 alpha/beta hydrolase [Planococcus sp. N022]
MRNYEIATQEGIVSYWEYGDERNPTIVCLHGLAGNGFYSFGELAPLLQENFHLIILDSPGHGKTTAFLHENDYMFSSLATWVHEIVGKIVQVPFIILGHSWGADVALHFTRFYSEKVSGLILLDGGFTFPQNQPEMTFDYTYSGWNTYMEQSEFADEEDIFQEYRTYTKRWDTGKEQYAASLFSKRNDGKLGLTASKFTVLAIIKAFFKEPFADAYPFIKVPTLLIYAAHPEHLNEARAKGILQLKTHIEDITVTAIDSAHMLQWDEPEQTASIINQWVFEKRPVI